MTKENKAGEEESALSPSEIEFRNSIPNGLHGDNGINSQQTSTIGRWQRFSPVCVPDTSGQQVAWLTRWEDADLFVQLKGGAGQRADRRGVVPVERQEARRLALPSQTQKGSSAAASPIMRKVLSPDRNLTKHGMISRCGQSLSRGAEASHLSETWPLISRQLVRDSKGPKMAAYDG
eukprot:scaffold235793_cov35-Prasinocladus_malaysianus.AAC.1